MAPDSSRFYRCPKLRPAANQASFEGESHTRVGQDFLSVPEAIIAGISLKNSDDISDQIC